MAFRAGQNDLWPLGGTQKIDDTWFGSAGKMGFFKKPGVDRSSADRFKAGPETLDVLLGNKRRHTELPRPFEQANRIGRDPLAIVNRRCQLLLDIDDEQQGIGAPDQHDGLSEDDSLVAVHQHPVLKVVAQAAGEHGFLDVLAVAHHVIR